MTPENRTVLGHLVVDLMALLTIDKEIRQARRLRDDPDYDQKQLVATELGEYMNSLEQLLTPLFPETECCWCHVSEPTRGDYQFDDSTPFYDPVLELGPITGQPRFDRLLYLQDGGFVLAIAHTFTSHLGYAINWEFLGYDFDQQRTGSYYFGEEDTELGLSLEELESVRDAFTDFLERLPQLIRERSIALQEERQLIQTTTDDWNIESLRQITQSNS